MGWPCWILTNCKSSPTFPAGQLSQISSVISWEPKTIKTPCTNHDCKVHYVWVSRGKWTNMVGECWAIRKCQRNQMNTTEMKRLRWLQGKTRQEHIRNVIIREKAHIKPINTFLMKKRLSCFGHVQRRDGDNVPTCVLNTRIDGYRPRGRPTLKGCSFGWMDRLNDDMVNTTNVQSGLQTERAGTKLLKTSTLPRKLWKG